MIGGWRGWKGTKGVYNGHWFMNLLPNDAIKGYLCDGHFSHLIKFFKGIWDFGTEYPFPILME